MGIHYRRIINFIKLSKIAKKYNTLLMVDIAHIAGLVATGVHPSPFSAKSGQALADIVTTTTHKTLRGPRGAMIMVTSKGLKKDSEIASKIDRAVFPGLQGGPHNNTTAGIAQCLIEAESKEFKDARPESSGGGRGRQSHGYPPRKNGQNRNNRERRPYQPKNERT